MVSPLTSLCDKFLFLLEYKKVEVAFNSKFQKEGLYGLCPSANEL